ncbi:hypothetical protein G7Y89_g57 [Cudoniella acicularis]|uniref:Ankyrin n=1 Tax=Cudoniella acicularis TaxID=354080 RepID=A0A8H4RYS3_9HELO|nr:hypothetical protein G7Y89_g57 [Cudoniella acicularis]
MDLIGCAASVLALLEVTARTAKALNVVVKHYRDAPAELIRLKHQVDGTKSQIVLLHYVLESVNGKSLKIDDADCAATLERFISDTITCFSAISSHIEQQSLQSRADKSAKLNISPSSPGLRLQRLVPTNSAIVHACRTGDSRAVWDLLHLGIASINDVTPENRPLLRYALESGSLEIVEYLINNGAEVNDMSGPVENQTLLLSKGADLDFVDSENWTPAFRVFTRTVTQTPALELFDILLAHSFTELNTQDGEGWTCLHRAAVYGVGNDITPLIKLGANTMIKTVKLCWIPIFCAVHFGNISTFTELMKHHPDFLTLKDVREWTLLHVAVNAKQVEIARTLVSLGADPHSLSLATDFFIPADLKGVSVTPGDIAKLRGPEVFAAYVEALKFAGQQVELNTTEMDEGMDLFWPAQDRFEEGSIS